MDATTATETPTAEPDDFEWAIVEIFGHRRHAGRAIEVERFGAKMLRVDVPTLTIVPGADDKPAYIVDGWTSHFYGGSSIFSYTLTDEKSAMRANRPFAPAQRFIASSVGDDDY